MFKQLKRSRDRKADGAEVGALETCCVCGRLTDVSKFVPISQRKCYVPGAGQLCRICCLDIYGTDDLRTLLTIE